MEVEAQKCSNEEHIEIDAISYCNLCKIYLCNKCQNYHYQLHKNHPAQILGKKGEVFSLDIAKKKIIIIINWIIFVKIIINCAAQHV